MKMLISMVLTLGIILFASQYMLNGGAGGIMFFGTGSGSGDAPKGIEDLGNAILDEDVTVYQWTDAQGVTHYGGTPPTGQGEYAKKEIRANTNVVQAHKIAEEEEEEEPEQRSRMAKVGSVYSPEGIKDLMDDTTNLKDELNQRAADQEKLMESILNPSAKK